MAGRPWVDDEKAVLLRCYSTLPTENIALALGRPIGGVHKKARAMGLEKSKEAMSPKLEKFLAGGVATRFQKGQEAWNKGVKGSTGMHENSRRTQFKPGAPPSENWNYKPIGSLRVTRDGILERKVTDDRSILPTRRWAAVARLVWEAQHGPVPPGHAVVFKLGMKTVEEALITIDRLELVTRAELMRRNSVHNYPPEIAKTLQLIGAIQRQINKREKNATNEQSRAARRKQHA